MSCHKVAAVLLAMGFAFTTSATFALDSGDITLTSIRGDVRIVVDGVPRTLKVGAALEPPATIETGRDGTVELKQGETSVSIGPDTKLDFPKLASKGGPIDRIVQQRGNAFYKIGKRGGRQLRVETPVLVGCIKGTQFNVAVDDFTSTISLFEGRLEVHAVDESDVIDLIAGEVAMRKSDGASISVIKMDASSAPVPVRPTSSRGEIGHGKREDVDTPLPRTISAASEATAVEVTPANPPPPVVDTGVPVNAAADVGTRVPTVTPPMDAAGTVLDQLKNDDAALGLDGNRGRGNGNDSDHDDSSNPGHSSHGRDPSPPNGADTVVEELKHHRK